jgi:hypothetical protein
MDRSVSSSNLIATSAYNSAPNSSLPNYLVRGYPTGEFLGRALGIINLEYRLPLLQLWHGNETFPFYFKRIHGAVVLDGVSCDGLAYDNSTTSPVYTRIRGEKSYWGAGLELKLDATLGYQFSMGFLVGVYYPLDRSLGPSSPNIGLALLL